MTAKHISSHDNGSFKIWRECLASKGIRKHGLFLVWGKKATEDLYRRHPEMCDAWLCQEETSAPQPMDARGARATLPRKYTLSRDLFAELDPFGVRDPILVCHTPKIATWNSDSETPGLELLCALSEPSNLGALVRTAAAFWVPRIVLLKECAHPCLPKSVRAASGTVFEIEFVVGPSIADLQEISRSETHPLIALDKEGSSIATFQWPKNARLLIGEEGTGLPESLPATKFISIPIAPEVESLNATVAASIALFHYQLRLKSM